MITLNHLGAEIHASRVRLWGSVGFIVAAVGVGFLVERWGVGLVPALLWGLFAILWGNSPLVPEAAPQVQVQRRRWARVLRQPAVIAFFTACFLSQAAHGPYYGFFSLYLETLGERQTIGLLWGWV